MLNISYHHKHIYISAIIPAHNEASNIKSAIQSIRPYVNKVIVACDNCKDNTKAIAIKSDADVVFNTKNNHYRKAGALNQALKDYIDWNIRNQYILIMDADTIVVNPSLWFKKATHLVYPYRSKLSNKARYMPKYRRLLLKFLNPNKYHKLFDNKAYDCIGSVFQAPKNNRHLNYITEGQTLEWEGYANKIERTRKVYILTGTCSMFSAKILRDVYGLHHHEYFYNNKALTEDFFMTLSVKKCHARLISPTACVCATEIKTNILSLLLQRRRWDAGALQALVMNKFNNITLPYWGQQLMLFISTFAFMLYILIAFCAYLTFTISFKWLWILVFIGFDINQVAEVWKYGNWTDRIYSAVMIGWLIYSFILQVAYLWGLYMIITGKKIYWNHKYQH